MDFMSNNCTDLSDWDNFRDINYSVSLFWWA